MAKIIERVFVFLLATFVAFAGVIFALTGGEGDFVLSLILWLLDGLAVWAVLKNPKEKSDDPCQLSPEARLQLKKYRVRFATMIGVALLLLLLFVVFATALPSMSFFAQHPSPLIIDEVQRVPELLSWIQARVDEFGENGVNMEKMRKCTDDILSCNVVYAGEDWPLKGGGRFVNFMNAAKLTRSFCR